MTRRYPYASPGWLTAYATGLALWSVIAGCLGMAVVVALIWFGFAVCCAAAHGMGADR